MKNKIRTYIFYAVGEILLVVVGILIALQVNNWNEYRKARIASENTIKDLRVELSAVRNNLRRSKAFNKNLLDQIEPFLGGRLTEAAVKQDPEIIFAMVNYSTLTFDIPILEQELSSGHVMIEQDSMVRTLRDIKGKITRANEFRSYLEQIWNDEVIPYLVQEKAMIAVDRYFSKGISQPEISVKLYKDEIYKNLAAANHSFLEKYNAINDELLTLLDQALEYTKNKM